MIIRCLPTGMFGSNCYVVGNNGEGIIIDPGVDSREIINVVRKTGLKIINIILTHAHIDHICSMDAVRDALGATVMIHRADAEALTDPWYNGSALFGISSAFRQADRILMDEEVFKAGELDIHIIHTPGHTPGGICIKIGGNIFTGDTLFRMSIGRTDLGGGDYKEIINSIKSKLMRLDDDTVIYSGHGEASTIGYEKKNNPFIRI